MPEAEEVEMTETETETENTEVDDTAVEAEETTEEDPLAKLKSALAAERKARRDEEKKRKAAEQALADKDKPAEEAAIEAARREAEESAQARANERIAKAELRAAAAGKVSNLGALTRLVDISQIEVDADGNPSADDIEEAVTQFLTDFPEFAVDKSKFPGTADQGSKGRQTQKRQLTREDIKSMSPEQILKAQEEGLLKDLMGAKS